MSPPGSEDTVSIVSLCAGEWTQHATCLINRKATHTRPLTIKGHPHVAHTPITLPRHSPHSSSGEWTLKCRVSRWKTCGWSSCYWTCRGKQLRFWFFNTHVFTFLGRTSHKGRHMGQASGWGHYMMDRPIDRQQLQFIVTQRTVWTVRITIQGHKCHISVAPVGPEKDLKLFIRLIELNWFSQILAW